MLLRVFKKVARWPSSTGSLHVAVDVPEFIGRRDGRGHECGWRGVGRGAVIRRRRASTCREHIEPGIRVFRFLRRAARRECTHIGPSRPGAIAGGDE